MRSYITLYVNRITLMSELGNAKLLRSCILNDPPSHPSTYFRHHYRPYHVISVTSVPCLPLKIVCDCWGMKHGACTRCVWKSWKFCFYPWNNCTSQNCMFYVSFQSSKYCNSNHCLHINLREIIHIHTNCIYSENDGSIKWIN